MKLNHLALVLLTAPLALTAQAGQITFTPMGGYQVFDDKLDRLTPPGIDDHWVYGGSIGYRFTRNIAAELNYLRTDTDRTNTSGEGHDNLYSANGLYNFNANGKFQPFLLLGVGQRHLKVDAQPRSATDTVVNGGVGAFYKLTDNFRLRGELRAVQDTDEKYLDGIAIVGLELAYGGFGQQHTYAPAPQPEPAPAPAPEPARAQPAPVVVEAPPADSDHDGVPDARDKCPNTPAGALVDDNGCPKVLVESINRELKILFDANKAVVKPEYKSEVEEVAKLAKEYPTADIEIQGHTDASGSKKLNDKLSEERAHAVRDMLVQDFGIDAKRLSYKGYGSSQPVADNKTAAGKAKNRRVIAIVAGERKQIEMKQKHKKAH